MTHELGPLPEPHLHSQALAVMNAGWERCGHVYTADQMRSYAAAEVARAVAAERERCAVIAETPVSGEQDDITMEAKDRVAAAIRALK